MSQSSSLRISIGDIALEFSYGTGSVAAKFGVPVGESDSLQGDMARKWIAEHMRKTDEHFPDAHVALVLGVLAAHDADFSDEEKLEYEHVYNQIHLTLRRYD